MWPWLCTTIFHKKAKLFFLVSLAFLQKVSTTYYQIVSHTKSVGHIWNMEKAEGFGGWAFPFKECIMYLELSEMTENYIEGQLHGHFYMFYLIIPGLYNALVWVCSWKLYIFISLYLIQAACFIHHQWRLTWKRVLPTAITAGCWSIRNCDVVKTFVKNLPAIHEFVSPRMSVSGRERHTRVNIDAHSVPSLLRSIWIHISLRRTNNLEESSSLASLPPGPTESLFIVSLSQQLVLFSTLILLLFLYSPRHSGWISCKFSDELLTKP